MKSTLQSDRPSLTKNGMNAMNDVIFWVFGLVLAGALAQLAMHFFSDEARARRKRRRNYGRVINRAKRPAVMLNARAK